MKENKDQSRAILAVVLSGIILIGWNYLFNPKKEKVFSQNREDIIQEKFEKDKRGEQLGNKREREEIKESVFNKREQEKNHKVKEYTVFKGGNSYIIEDSLSILNADTHLATGSFNNVASSKKPIEFFFLKDGRYTKPHLKFKNESGARLVGSDLNLGLAATLEILDSGKLFIGLDFKTPTKSRVVFNKQISTSGESSSALGFLSSKDMYKGVDRFVLFEKDVEGIHVGEQEEADIQLKWLGLDVNYHLLAYVFSQKHSVRYKATEKGQLLVDFNEEVKILEGNIAYAKKYYHNLKSLEDNLSAGIDFGFFAIVAEPLLRALIAIKGIFPNWGIAIILLTLIIRFLTFPLYYKQMKSMNKMKKIQPQLKALKEKYKGDTRRQQMETMELFKREGVNPMGGCLPLILQMPIFIAFYKVLTVSAELDNQPFVGWIGSLTAKDPYYILPILVTILMWLNQKIMPSATADPTQQKIMNFIPFIFGFIFLNMPAGLNLYILVSTAFGVAQQLFVNKRMETA